MADITLGSDKETGEPILFRQEARSRGLYVLGKSGFGKTTLMTNMAAQDILNGQGMLVIDPHGTLIANVLGWIPPNRAQDTILIDLSDPQTRFFVNAFQLPEDDPDIRIQYAAHVTDAIRKAFGARYPWGIQIQTITMMSLAVLLHFPKLHIGRLAQFLTDKDYRNTLLAQVNDQTVTDWWHWFDSLTPMLKQEFLRVPMSRLPLIFTDRKLKEIICQSQSSLNFTEIINSRQIVLIRFPELMPEGSTALLGTLVIGQLLAAAFARQDVSEPFMVYVDEYDRFDTEDYGTILDKLRYKNICLTFAHQHRGQLVEERRNFPLSAANLCCFQLMGTDAERLSVEFSRDPLPPEMVSKPMTMPIYRYTSETVYDNEDGKQGFDQAQSELVWLAPAITALRKWQQTYCEPSGIAFAPVAPEDIWSALFCPVLAPSPGDWHRVDQVPREIRETGRNLGNGWTGYRFPKAHFRVGDYYRGHGYLERLPPDHGITGAIPKTFFDDFWNIYERIKTTLPEETEYRTRLRSQWPGAEWEIPIIPEARQLYAWIESAIQWCEKRIVSNEEQLKGKRVITHEEYLYEQPVQDEIVTGQRQTRSGRMWGDDPVIEKHYVTRMQQVPGPKRPIADIQKEVGARLVSYPVLQCRVRLLGQEKMEEHELVVPREEPPFQAPIIPPYRGPLPPPEPEPAPEPVFYDDLPRRR